MLKLALFSGLVLTILTLHGFLANSQDNQCEDSCLTKLHPMIELVPETNFKLERIHGEQKSIQMKLLAVQSTVEAQRITMQNSLKNITTKEDLKSQLQLLTTKMESQDTTMQTKLDGVNSEFKSQLQYLQTNLEDQQKPLLESLQRTITKDDFEERLNVTEEHLLASNSELTTQLKEMHINIQSNLDSQLLAVQKKLEVQNTALSESFEAGQKGTEEQLRLFETRIEAQLKELQNETEIQLLELKKEQSTFQKTLLETLSTIQNKIFDPRFELIGSRYFYIEHNIKKTWDEAASTCRAMGGYLAAFKTEEEIAAVMQKLINGSCCWYWTGIKKEDGKFISTASGKPAPHFKWLEGQPDNNDACVMLDNRGLNDYTCSYEAYFICQSDNET